MGLLEVTLVVGTLLAVLTWVGVVFLAPSRAMGSSSPARRLIMSRLWLYAPLWVPLLILAAALIPGIVGVILDQSDHCLLADGHHHHLCLIHPPHAANHLASWLLPLTLIVPVALIFSRCGVRAWREWRLTQALVASSRPSSLGQDVRLLDQPEPVALTVGWRRPTILLSIGLFDSVSPATLRVVLAHERAHITRADTWFALCDKFPAALLPSAVWHPLVREIALAREQACDAIAARREGGPLTVAAALTEVARLGMAAPAYGISVVSSPLEARVTHLLHPPQESRRWMLMPFACVTVLLAAGLWPVHSLVEPLVSLLLH